MEQIAYYVSTGAEHTGKSAGIYAEIRHSGSRPASFGSRAATAHCCYARNVQGQGGLGILDIGIRAVESFPSVL